MYKLFKIISFSVFTLIAAILVITGFLSLFDAQNTDALKRVFGSLYWLPNVVFILSLVIGLIFLFDKSIKAYINKSNNEQSN